MTLLDRYLRAVAAQLPKDTRDDIVAELRDVALNRFEEREAELGRPLTEHEQEGLIREMGHPLTVAGRYRSGPAHLIGPELYPYWLFAVKVGLAAVAVITVLATVIQWAAGSVEAPQIIGLTISGMIQSGITLIGIATLAGAILERQATRPKFMTEWRVKDLGLFELAAIDTEAFERSFAARSGGRPGRRRRETSGAANALASAVVMLVFLLWWTGALPIADLRPGAGSVVIGGIDYGSILTAIVEVAFWPVIAYLAARIALELFRAWRPRARRRVAVGQLALAALRLAAALWIWNLSPLAPVIHVDSAQAFVDAIQRMFSGRFDLPALLMLVVVGNMFEAVGTMAQSLWRLVTPDPRGEEVAA